MLNIRELEDLRTKEELINYFKEMGKNITEEEIAALKQSYAKAEANSNTLTMQQLNDVAGGIVFFIFDRRTKDGRLSHISYGYIDDDKSTIKIVDSLRHSKTDPTKCHVDEEMIPEQFFHKYGLLAEKVVNHAVDKEGKSLRTNFEAGILRPNTQVLVQSMHDMMSDPNFHENLAMQVFAEPFHRNLHHLLDGFEGELKPIGDSLIHYVESKNPRVQAFVNMAAMHVTSVGMDKLKKQTAGITSLHNVIKFASESNEFPKHLYLVHEIAHCLDNKQYCSEHMKNAIESTNIGKENYLKISEAARFSDNSDYAILTLHEITNILPKSFYIGSSDKLILGHEDHIASEVFVRLAEFYVYTNGSWMVNEFNLREIFPELTNAFETEIQTLFDRAKTVGVALPPEATEMPEDILVPTVSREPFDKERLLNAAPPVDATTTTTTTTTAPATAFKPNKGPAIVTDVTAAAVETKTATTSEDPVSIPEKLSGEFTGLKTLTADRYSTLTLCEKTTDKTKYIIEENKILGTQICKVLKEFENEGNKIYIYADRNGFFHVCGILKDGSVFDRDMPFSNRLELQGLIIDAEPFVSKYNDYRFAGKIIKLNEEVKFKEKGEIKVDVDGISYVVTEYVSPDNADDRVYAHSNLKLERKQTADGEIVYVIPTKNGEYYRYDFKYETYGEKIEEELVSEVPEKSLPAVDQNTTISTTTTTTTASSPTVEPDVRPNMVTGVPAAAVGTKTATTSEDPVSIPEKLSGEFTGLKTLTANQNSTLTLCEKITDKTKYIIEKDCRENRVYKVLREFENEGNKIYIYANRNGFFYVCGILKDGSVFNKGMIFPNRLELQGLIIDAEPFASKYDDYRLAGGIIKLNGEVKFNRLGEIKVDVDGVSYDVTVYVDPNKPNKRLYAHSSLKLEKKHTANSEIIYVIPTKNGEYYRYDFKYKTYGEKIEEKLFDVPVSEVPEKEMPASIPEELSGEFKGLKTLTANQNSTLTLCEKKTDKTKYIIEKDCRENRVYKVLREFEYQGKNIYIYAESPSFFSVCVILKDSSVFNECICLMDNSHPFSKSYPELFGLIIKNAEPFVSKYDDYYFNGVIIKLNEEVKFKEKGEIKVDVDGVSYDVTEWVSADNPNERVYGYVSLILERKQTDAGEIVYVIPTKNGEYYRCDFKYETYGEKIEEKLVSEVPEKVNSAHAPTTTTTAGAPISMYKKDENQKENPPKYD